MGRGIVVGQVGRSAAYQKVLKHYEEVFGITPPEGVKCASASDDPAPKRPPSSPEDAPIPPPEGPRPKTGPPDPWLNQIRKVLRILTFVIGVDEAKKTISELKGKSAEDACCVMFDRMVLHIEKIESSK